MSAWTIKGEVKYSNNESLFGLKKQANKITYKYKKIILKYNL